LPDDPTLPDNALVSVATRHDGWTPQRQRGFLEALADSGSVESAARSVGMSARSAYRLRGRADARAFTAAWNAALERAMQRLFPAAIDRALHGTVRQRWYHGEMIAEDRVYSDRLLVWLLEKGGQMLAGGEQRREIGRNWDEAMDALEAGEPDPPPVVEQTKYRVWRNEIGQWRTNCFPPPRFRRYQAYAPGTPHYQRALTDEEWRALMSRRYHLVGSEEDNRRRFFGLSSEPDASDEADVAEPEKISSTPRLS
jgi:hypothetical protein